MTLSKKNFLECSQKLKLVYLGKYVAISNPSSTILAKSWPLSSSNQTRHILGANYQYFFAPPALSVIDFNRLLARPTQQDGAMIILHGDNVVKSRQRLVELEEEIRQQKGQINLLSAKALTPQLLEENLGNRSLFNIEQIVVIEELHSLPESAKKKQLIVILTKIDLPIILWEKRLLTPTMIKKFGQATVETFKVSNQLFNWLDSLGTDTDKAEQIKVFHRLNQTENVQFCFTMLVRQIRLLLSALDDGKLAGAPFIISKLKKQARQFSLGQLLSIHHQLLEIDFKHKRSATALDFEQELDLLLLSM